MYTGSFNNFIQVDGNDFGGAGMGSIIISGGTLTLPCILDISYLGSFYSNSTKPGLWVQLSGLSAAGNRIDLLDSTGIEATQIFGRAKMIISNDGYISSLIDTAAGLSIGVAGAGGSLNMGSPLILRFGAKQDGTNPGSGAIIKYWVNITQ